MLSVRLGGVTAMVANDVYREVQAVLRAIVVYSRVGVALVAHDGALSTFVGLLRGLVVFTHV